MTKKCQFHKLIICCTPYHPEQTSATPQRAREFISVQCIGIKVISLCRANLISICVQSLDFQLSPLLVLICLFFYISSQQINFDLELEPVKLLGSVEVVRSLADKKKGPKFYVHAKRNPLEAEVNNYDIFIIL